MTDLFGELRASLLGAAGGIAAAKEDAKLIAEQAADQTEDKRLEAYLERRDDLAERVGGLLGDLMRHARAMAQANGWSAKMDVIVLSQRPVQSITSLYFDQNGYWGDAPDAFGPDKLLTEGVDYALDRDQPDGSSLSGIVYRINAMWPRHKAKVNPFGGQSLIAVVPQVLTGNIKVTYVAGYGTVPGAVKLATETAVARLWQSGQFGAMVQSEQYEDYRYTLASQSPDDLLGPAKPFLAQFKEFVV